MKRQRPDPSPPPDFILTSLLEENVWEVGYHLENPTDNLMWAMTCQWAMQHLLKLKCVVPPPALATWIITVYSTGNHKQIVWFEHYLKYAAPKLQTGHNVMITRWKGVLLRCMRDRSWWNFRPQEFLGGAAGFVGLPLVVRERILLWMTWELRREQAEPLQKTFISYYSEITVWLRDCFKYRSHLYMASDFQVVYKYSVKEAYRARVKAHADAVAAVEAARLL